MYDNKTLKMAILNEQHKKVGAFLFQDFSPQNHKQVVKIFCEGVMVQPGMAFDRLLKGQKQTVLLTHSIFALCLWNLLPTFMFVLCIIAFELVYIAIVFFAYYSYLRYTYNFLLGFLAKLIEHRASLNFLKKPHGD